MMTTEQREASHKIIKMSRLICRTFEIMGASDAEGTAALIITLMVAFNDRGMGKEDAMESVSMAWDKMAATLEEAQKIQNRKH